MPPRPPRLWASAWIGRARSLRRSFLLCAALAASLAAAAPAAADDTLTGRLRGIHTDSFDGGSSTTRWQLDTGRRTVDVLPTTVPALTQGNNRVVMEDQTPGAAVSGPVQAASGFASPALGAHKTAVIAFNFLNDTSQPWTTNAIRSSIFTRRNCERRRQGCRPRKSSEGTKRNITP
jgi:hypothetical protein